MAAKQSTTGRAWEDYYPAEDYQPKPLIRRSHWIALALGLSAGALLGYSAHAEGETPSFGGSSPTPQNHPFAQEACQIKKPDCLPPPVRVTWCGKWFQAFDVSDEHNKRCIAKLPRLFETNATDDAKRYMLCHCEFQGSIWDRRDP